MMKTRESESIPEQTSELRYTLGAGQSENEFRAELMMRITSRLGRVTILVEAGDDKEHYGRFFHDPSAIVAVDNKKFDQIRNNKKLIVDIVRNFANRDFLIIGLVDADFDRVMGRIQTESSLVVTDTHDMETMLVSTPSVSDSFIKRIQTLLSYPSSKAPGLIEEAATVAYEIGVLQYEAGTPPFNQLEIDDILKAGDIDRNASIAILARRKKLTVGEAAGRLEESSRKLWQMKWDVINGHVLLKVIGERIMAINVDSQRLPHRETELRYELMRLYSCRDFSRSAMCIHLREIESRSKLKILDSRVLPIMS